MMNSKKGKSGRILAFIIAFVLILNCQAVFASEEDNTDYQEITQETEYVETDVDQELFPEEVEQEELFSEEDVIEEISDSIDEDEIVVEDETWEESFQQDALAAATAVPTTMWVRHSDSNNLPADIEVFKVSTSGNNQNKTYTCQLFLPGNVALENCVFSWDGGMMATVDGQNYASGECPIPAVNSQQIYTFKNGNTTVATFNVTSYQGSPNVQPIFIIIDETYVEDGETTPHTIAAMDADDDHEAYCVGEIYINGEHFDMPKIKGRGNATWEHTKDKKPYNVTLGSKTTLGLETPETKKWSFLAEAYDHSLLCNRSGFYLARQLGIAQDTMSADVWMNGEYQGCYTITPKTDSFVTKNGFMIEQDNYQERPVANGGDPQFSLNGLKSYVSGWTSAYNLITVKKMGDNLLKVDGVVDESPENLEAVAYNTLKPWLQEALDAILAEDGINPTTGKSYTEYIDIVSFAKMYLMHEYVKSYDVCAGSILFYRDGITDDYKLMAGPLWDLDNALGATCPNKDLGSQSDRRSAQGDFIVNIKEYKTSIYKNLGKHEDFMNEVKRQYNRYKDAFDHLQEDVQDLINEIRLSAKMNHIKVTDLTGTYVNLHKYSNDITLGSGDYEQKYLATIDSKTDWENYAENLKTYIRVRSLWFDHNYYDPNYVCEHEYGPPVVTPPTCTTEGFTTHTCKFCGESYVDDVLPIIEHDYQDGECVVCGQKLINVTITCTPGVSVTVYETQDTNGAHVDNAEIANPRNGDTGFIDCSGDGQINFKIVLEPGYQLVDNGNYGMTIEPTGTYKNLKDQGDNVFRLTKITGDFTLSVYAEEPTHNYGDWTVTKEATCTEAGSKERVCEYCGDKEIEAIEALGHDLVQHEAKAATCTEIGWDAYETCTRCDYTTYVEIPATGHTVGEAVRENEKPATCEMAGSYDEVTYCTVCEAELSRVEKEIEALGHDLVQHEAKAATCTGIGWVTYETCTRCDYTTYAEIPATGHLAGEPVRENEKPATCEKAGSYDEVTYCTFCEEELSRVEKEIEALGHDLVQHEAKAATCTEIGWDAYETCTRCDYTTYVEIPATGHTAGEAVRENEKPATCEKAGSYDEVTYCTVCEAELSRVAKEIKALGHDLVQHEAKAATCTGIGWNAYETCTRCDYSTYAEIPATGHRYGEWTVTKKATCTEAGSRKRICENCDNAEIEAIPATGHTAGEAVRENEKPATCEKAGSYDEVTYCTVCEAELSRVKKEVKALGHDLVQHEAKAATCTEIGWNAYETCTRCDYTTYVEIPATGHHYGEWKVTKEATCTEEGSREKVCADCGDKVTEKIEAKGHIWNKDYTVDKEATCKEAGSKSIHCSVCNAVKEGSEVTIPKTDDHKYGNWVVTKEATCTESGSREKVCATCGDKVTEKIEAKGHSWDEWIVTIPATVLEDGEETRTCANCGETETRVIPATGHLFNDVQDDSIWYFDTVYKIASTKNVNGKPLMSGYADGSNNFGPADPLTRQDFAVILYRLADEPEVSDMDNPFLDTQEDGYYYRSILWAKAEGVIAGYNDGRFGVGDKITREQVATILYRFAKDYLEIDTTVASEMGDLSKFTDGQAVSDWAEEALTWATGAKVITGKDNGTKLDARGNAARSEIAAMVLRFITYMNDNKN